MTSDGILLAGDTSDPMANAILGRADELAANLSRLADGRSSPMRSVADSER